MTMEYKLKTINIKGKEYVTVNERVKAFRAIDDYKGFSISTEILQLDAESCCIKATACNANGQVVATGIAQEFRNAKGSMVNSTSYVENCETSAVGRCLGFLGIGIENSIATADEVRRAIQQQEALEKQPKQSDEPYWQAQSYDFLASNAKALAYYCDMYKVRTLDEFDEMQLTAIFNDLKKHNKI